MKLQDIDNPFLSNIQRECSNSVEVYQKEYKYLYHGSRSEGDVKKFSIRTDRRPLDAAPSFTNFFNLCFEQKYRIKRVRNRVKFLSNKKSNAENYGQEVYMAFVPNTSILIYAPGYSDSIIHDTHWTVNAYFLDDYLEPILDVPVIMPNDIKNYADELIKIFQTTKELHELKSFDYNLWSHDMVLQYLQFINKKIFHIYNVARATTSTQEKLVQLTPTTEIMVYDVPHFYGINIEDITSLKQMGVLR